jgi:hypothetical protein
MAGTIGDYSVRISGKDEVTEVVEKINRALFGIGKTSTKVTSEAATGFSKISINARAASIVANELGARGSRALERFGRAADDVGSRLGAFVPSLASLTSLATLGGLAEVSRQAATFGTSIMKTSAQAGVSTLELQRWVNGMDRAGFSAENTASMLENVNKTSLNARAGLDPAAFGIAQLKHINLTGDTKETILSIADALKKMHEQGANPESEGQVLDAFGISRDHIALMEQGRQAILDLLDARGSASGLSKKEIGELNELDKAYRTVGQAASDFGKKIAADLSPPMVAASNATGKWLDQLRQEPGAMKAVEIAVASLGTVLTTSMAARLIAFLAGVTGLKGILGGIFSGPGMAVALPSMLSGDTPGAGQRSPKEKDYDDNHFLGGTIGRFVNHLFGWDGPSASGGAGSATGALPTATGNIASIAMPSDTGLSGSEVSINNFGGIRRPGVNAGPIGGGFQSFATPAAGIVATAALLQRYQDQHGLNTLRGIISRWAPPSENDTASLISRATAMTGFGADQPLNLHDASTLSGVTEAMIRGEVGTGGPSHDLIDQAIEGLNGGDTSHEVTVNINGAPPGSRASITGADGPARLNLRTSYSMGDVW